MIEINKIYQGDCLEIMKNIPDGSIDCIITDPPYLINYKTNHRIDKTHNFNTEIKNDDISSIELIQQSIREMYRVLKENSAAYIFCSPKTVDIFKKSIKDTAFKIKNQIIWVKNNWTAGDLQAQFGQRYEIIFLINKGRKLINGKRLTDVWFFDRVSGKQQLHQNQKPIDLLEQCIEKHTNESDLILDPFMGSGSTCIACLNTNRNYIGIELDEKYFNIAKCRILNYENTL